MPLLSVFEASIHYLYPFLPFQIMGVTGASEIKRAWRGKNRTTPIFFLFLWTKPTHDRENCGEMSREMVADIFKEVQKQYKLALSGQTEWKTKCLGVLKLNSAINTFLTLLSLRNNKQSFCSLSGCRQKPTEEPRKIRHILYGKCVAATSPS